MLRLGEVGPYGFGVVLATVGAASIAHIVWLLLAGAALEDPVLLPFTAETQSATTLLVWQQGALGGGLLLLGILLIVSGLLRPAWFGGDERAPR